MATRRLARLPDGPASYHGNGLARFLRTWWPVFLLLAGLGAEFVRVETRQAQIREDLDDKANRELVEAQYREIIRRLDRIENRIDGTTGHD